MPAVIETPLPADRLEPYWLIDSAGKLAPSRRAYSLPYTVSEIAPVAAREIAPESTNVRLDRASYVPSEVDDPSPGLEDL